MSEQAFKNWIEENHPKHVGLTDSVVTITKSLLSSSGVDYLTVDGRTKSIPGCLEKITRKGYRDPSSQLTDISGIRIIVYFEHDIPKVTKIIEESFRVDKDNSLNKDQLLSKDQIGYRSVHYVCDMGEQRAKLPEFTRFENLKFEFQVRTVLQHAWAELAHDRNYKFSGSLPHEIERRIYLFAGMLEIADSGFSEIALAIDNYEAQVSTESEAGNLDIEINSISLPQFVSKWAENNGIKVKDMGFKNKDYEPLINELKQYGIKNLSELNEIIPKDYGKLCKKYDGGRDTILGLVRNWMILNDHERFLNDVEVNWVFTDREMPLFEEQLGGDVVDLLFQKAGMEGLDPEDEH